MELPKDYIDAYISKTNEVESTLQDLLQIIFATSNPNDLEGNSFYHHLSTNRFSELFPKQVNLTWCGSKATHKICEIGFNAGHSAYLFLLLNKSLSLTFTIFDIGEHVYTQPCINYLQQKFPHVKFLFAKGDSTKLLPGFIEQYSHELSSYDVVHVDGGHSFECAHSDIYHAHLLLRAGGYMIIDDTNVSYISDFVNTLLKTNTYKEIDILPTVGYKHRIIQKLV
jgi:hypothetical protein